MPLDMWGSAIKIVGNVAECQALCAATEQCAHFSYWEPMQHCHLTDHATSMAGLTGVVMKFPRGLAKEGAGSWLAGSSVSLFAAVGLCGGVCALVSATTALRQPASTRALARADCPDLDLEPEWELERPRPRPRPAWSSLFSPFATLGRRAQRPLDMYIYNDLAL